MKLSIIDAVDVVVVFGRGACPDPVDADAKGGRERMGVTGPPVESHQEPVLLTNE